MCGESDHVVVIRNGQVTEYREEDNSSGWVACLCLCLLIAVLVSIGVGIVSITLIILLFGAWLPYVCYGRPNNWKEYVCQYLCLAFCWCSKNRPPLWMRNIGCTCYEIDEDPNGRYIVLYRLNLILNINYGFNGQH